MKSIHELRIERQLSQTTLAQAVGAHQTQISSWERKKTRPTPHAIERLTEYFGVPAEEIDLAPFRRNGPPLGWTRSAQTDEERG